MDYSKLSTQELRKLKREAEYKVSKYKNLQLALKVQLNSAYGALGSPYFRFYDIRQAEAVTLSGQACIMFIGKRINDYMNHILKTDNVDYVVATDTDSVYIKMGPLVEQIFQNKNVTSKKKVEFLDKLARDKIEPFIADCFEEFSDYMNSSQRTLKMKREAIADRAIWTAKKKYILNVYDDEGVAYDEPKITKKGIESVRSSTPDVVKSKIDEAIYIIMNENQKSLQNFIKEFEKEFSKMDPSEIGRPSGANNLKKYSCPNNIFKTGTPQHVKGCLIYNHLLKQMKLDKKYTIIEEGEKIKSLYIYTPNMTNTNCISFIDVLPKEFNLEDKIDYETQFEKTFLSPVKSILEAIGWTAKKENSLEDLFEME